MYFVYILACLQIHRSCVGQTDQLLRRYAMDKARLTKTTRDKLLKAVMVNWESFSTRSQAMQHEATTNPVPAIGSNGLSSPTFSSCFRRKVSAFCWPAE
jgi:predicted GIY-YIG superfamily endonuclease